MNQRPGLRWQVGMLLVLVTLIGCKGKTAGDQMIAAANKTNMHRLCNLYNYYQAKNGWKGPKSEAEFREFVAGQSSRILERMGVDPAGIDSLFVSERDGQPFVVKYGVAGSSRGSQEPVVFESVGVNGKRMVGFTSTEQREVDDSEYDSLMNKKAG